MMKKCGTKNMMGGNARTATYVQNMIFLPLKRSLERAYPAGTETTRTAIVDTPAT
jgi:hypothetical protein